MISLSHLLHISYWPILTGLGSLTLMMSFGFWFKFGLFISTIPLLNVILVSYLWFRDVARESMAGEHTSLVQDGLKLGMLLFIFSEVCFFGAFFWSFFHFSLVPDQSLGMMWPSNGLVFLNPFSVPLLNTVVLLSSGVTVTWAHHNMLLNESATLPLAATIGLGAYFTALQGMEYFTAAFGISDSAFGSVFYVGTGFHGLHVLIGSIFLAIMLMRIVAGSLTAWNHLGFEMAIWYWHFVDVVWLFLYSWFYWWSY